MNLRGIEFPNVFTSSGARGVFGEGYRYHNLPPWRYFIDYTGSAFVSKTVTLEPTIGHMEMEKDGITPRHFKPTCVKANFRRAFVLNAVGLSNAGALALLELKGWQRLTEPFLISFMSVSPTRKGRLEELAEFVVLLQSRMRSSVAANHFQAPFGLEINYSCPNVGHDLSGLLDEVGVQIDVAQQLKIPVIPNFSALTPAAKIGEISRLVKCDAVSVCNTIPWGQVPELIDWTSLFGTIESPLKKAFGKPGGLSGAPILPVTLRWLLEARFARVSKPLIVGGGIMSPNDAEMVLRAGFPIISAVKLGVVGLLRPWNVAKIIRCVQDNIGHQPVWRFA